MCSVSPNRIIGVTGGLGTGKSTVAQILQSQSIPIWDADLAARRAVAPGTPALAAIVERFGPEILRAGQLDRAKLGQIVFADPSERQWLEAQIHPPVGLEAATWLATQTSPTVALIVPLLFESGLTHWVTEIWVVTCNPELQRQRVQRRDGLTDTALAQRIGSQWPLDQKVALADVVLSNDADVESLTTAVLRLLSPSPK